jgi:hypothetical protein
MARVQQGDLFARETGYTPSAREGVEWAPIVLPDNPKSYDEIDAEGHPVYTAHVVVPPYVPQLQNVLRDLPKDAAERKDIPVCTGVIDYFPLALLEIARVSKAGNDQHNPGGRLHWARGKSADHADCIVRHLIQRGTRDSDGHRHLAKVAWRALALLQEEIEADAGFVPGEGS